MLEKTARKPSSDPVQEKLRQDKANWNKEISSFINDLIHLKKTMNGWPSKFYKERSRITTPIPADPNTIIGSLANDFQQLAQRGEAIVQEQLNYSKSRRQKQPKAPAAPTPQAPATPAAPQAQPTTEEPDLAKQLAAWEQKYELVSEGSNKLTRTWTRLINPTIGWGSGTKRRRHRMNMLKRAALVYKLLGKLQVKIVAPLSSKQTIKDSYELVRTIKAEWESLGKTLDMYKKVAGHELSKEETEGNFKEDNSKKTPNDRSPVPDESSNSPTDEQVNFLANVIRGDYIAALQTNIGQEIKPVLGNFVDAFSKGPPLTKLDAARNLIQQYQSLLNTLSTKYNVNGDSLKNIANAIRVKEQAAPLDATTPKNASDQLEATAQAALKKWLGKARHNIIPNDTSDYRINIFDMAKDIRENINEFMNLAESRKTLVADYEKNFSSISSNIQKLYGDMMKLYRIYFRVPKELSETLGI